jgi:hypothetical protein
MALVYSLFLNWHSFAGMCQIEMILKGFNFQLLEGSQEKNKNHHIFFVSECVEGKITHLDNFISGL